MIKVSPPRSSLDPGGAAWYRIVGFTPKQKRAWNRESRIPHDEAHIPVYGALADLGGLELHQGCRVAPAFRVLQGAAAYVRHPLFPTRGLIVWSGDVGLHQERHWQAIRETVYVTGGLMWTPLAALVFDDLFRPSMAFWEQHAIARIEAGQLVWSSRMAAGVVRSQHRQAIDAARASGPPLPVCCEELTDAEIAERARALRQTHLDERRRITGERPLQAPTRNRIPQD